MKKRIRAIKRISIGEVGCWLSAFTSVRAKMDNLATSCLVSAIRFLRFFAKHGEYGFDEPCGLRLVFVPCPAEFPADQGGSLYRMQLGAAEGEELVPMKLFAL
jgi:hypothetical protein